MAQRTLAGRWSTAVASFDGPVQGHVVRGKESQDHRGWWRTCISAIVGTYVYTRLTYWRRKQRSLTSLIWRERNLERGKETIRTVNERHLTDKTGEWSLIIAIMMTNVMQCKPQSNMPWNGAIKLVPHRSWLSKSNRFHFWEFFDPHVSEMERVAAIATVRRDRWYSTDSAPRPEAFAVFISLAVAIDCFPSCASLLEHAYHAKQSTFLSLVLICFFGSTNNTLLVVGLLLCVQANLTVNHGWNSSPIFAPFFFYPLP